MKHLSAADKQKLGASCIDMLKDLVYVGKHLRHARHAHDNLQDVFAEVNGMDLDFTVKSKEEIADEASEACPMLRELGVGQGDVADARHTHKFRIKLGGKRGAGIKLDGGNNFREGRSNSNWAVCKNTVNEAGEIVAAAVYLPNTHIAYVANQDTAYTVDFNKEPARVSELKVAAELKKPFLAEYGSWHRVTYSVPKAIFTSMVRENVGGSMRETGHKQLAMVWVATGERGLTVMNNMDHEPDMTGAFIAQKAGVTVAQVPIDNDREGRCTVFALHPTIADKVLGYFGQAMQLTKGWVKPGKTRIFDTPQEVMHGRC